MSFYFEGHYNLVGMALSKLNNHTYLGSLLAGDLRQHPLWPAKFKYLFISAEFL